MLLDDGKVLIAGGDERAEIYDESTNAFSVVPGSLLISRHYGTAMKLRDGTVLIAGGYAMTSPPPVSTDTAVLYH